MGTHGRPVMGSHRPGPMGPSIVLAPPPGWPDVARSQPFLSIVVAWRRAGASGWARLPTWLAIIAGRARPDEPERWSVACRRRGGW